jgi:DNA-binding MarR family transcriptional regulator
MSLIVSLGRPCCGIDSVDSTLIIPRQSLLVKKVLTRYHNPMDVRTTQQLLDRVSSLLRSEGRNFLREHGLQSVHFEVLHYLSRCNRYSDTPMAVTEYLGQTKGSVSQSLKVLEKKALISKQTDSKDKRVAHLTVTAEGEKLLDRGLPSPSLQAAYDALSETEISALDTFLGSMLRAIQSNNSFKSFGQCYSCVHNIELSSEEHLCGLTKEHLSIEEVRRICREHEYPDSLIASG